MLAALGRGWHSLLVPQFLVLPHMAQNHTGSKLAVIVSLSLDDPECLNSVNISQYPPTLMPDFAAQSSGDYEGIFPLL